MTRTSGAKRTLPMRRLRAVAAAMSAGLAALVAAGYAMFGIVYVQHYVPPPNRPIFRQLQLQLAGGRVTGQYDSNTSGSVFPMAIGWHFGQLSRSTTPSWRALRASFWAFEWYRNGNTGPRQSQRSFSLPLWPLEAACWVVPALWWWARRRRRLAQRFGFPVASCT
jgi:hypothetical protein